MTFLEKLAKTVAVIQSSPAYVRYINDRRRKISKKNEFGIERRRLKRLIQEWETKPERYCENCDHVLHQTKKYCAPCKKKKTKELTTLGFTKREIAQELGIKSRSIWTFLKSKGNQ